MSSSTNSPPFPSSPSSKKPSSPSVNQILKPPTKSLSSSKKRLPCSKKCDKSRRKITFNYGPFSPKGITINTPSSPPPRNRNENVKGKNPQNHDPKWKGKEVVEISSESDDSDSDSDSPPKLPSPKFATPSSSSKYATPSTPKSKTPSSSSEGGYGLFVSPQVNSLDPDYKPPSPPMCEQVSALRLLDDQVRSDCLKRKFATKEKPAKKAKKAKRPKRRFVKVFVGGADLTESGYTLLMPGDLRFKTLYKKYAGWQKYSACDFELWYGSKKLRMDQCPDDVGLPHEAELWRVEGWHDRAMMYEHHHWKKARAKKQPYTFKWNEMDEEVRKSYYFNWPIYFP